MTVINSVEEFLALKGCCLGESNWLEIHQDMINQFASVTKDNQWIHIDPQRASKESPYGISIAHGYLLISLIPFFLTQIIKINNLDRIINYSIDKMVFKHPVTAGSLLRMKAVLKSAKDLGGICLATIQCIFESKEADNPVFEGGIN